METNVCFGCRFGSVKIEILVPEKYNLKRFANQTRDFTADVVAVTGAKPIHYSLKVDSGQNTAELNFNIDCLCILNIDKRDCSKFNAATGRNCRVKHLEHIKPAEEPNLEVIRTV
jgi:hypothetical protein